MNCICGIPIVLTDMRTRAGFFQPYVAKQIGGTVQSISAWERGYRNPSMQSIARLCEAYGVTLSAFFAELEKYEQWLHEPERKVVQVGGRR